MILAGANRFGAAPAGVEGAVRQIEDAGDADGFLATASTRNGWRRGRVFSLLDTYRGLGALKPTATERLGHP